ncbi:MAG: DUF4190 domain-containing protein [Clostridiaceae bacterium]|nr:DUF4190 domain-containing protein [Clostridiaceae bacterium]
MKNCPRCNYSNDDFNIVCVGCGSALDEVVDTELNYIGNPNPPVIATTNALAITSLVMGIATILCCGILSPFALIFGIIAKRQIRNSAGQQKGDGMALAGIILGAVGLLIFVGSIALIVINYAITKNTNNF